MDPDRKPLGHALGRGADGPAGRCEDGLPAAPRARACAVALLDQLPGQYRRPEACGRNRRDLRLRLRILPGGDGAGGFRPRRPIHRPYFRARKILLRPRLRRPCLGRASDLQPPVLGLCRGRAGRGYHRPRPWHLPCNGRAAILEPRRIQALSRGLGLRRDRHDQHARGQARPRGGALLRLRRHDHRLRQLASGSRRGGRDADHPDASGQCRQGAQPCPATSRTSGIRPHPLPPWLRPCAGIRHPHPTARPRSRACGEA